MNATAGWLTSANVVLLAALLRSDAWRRTRRRVLVESAPAPRGTGRGPVAVGSYPRAITNSALGAAPAWLRSALESADVGWPAAKVWLCWIAALAATLVAGAVLGGPGLALLAVAVAVAAPLAVLKALDGRRDEHFERALPDVLEATARSLRSGASLRGALSESAVGSAQVLSADLAGVVEAAGAGAPLADALDDWAAARPLPGVRLAVAAVALSAASGGAGARALDGVAATLRDRLALGRELRALSSQARISAMVIALAPLGFAALAVGLDGTTADFLLRSPAGLLCLALGIGLDAVAAWWMTRITRAVS
ncbi:hypothetical protein BH18ACT4_BH18ACT4_12790 [soil metagenome]